MLYLEGQKKVSPITAGVSRPRFCDFPTIGTQRKASRSSKGGNERPGRRVGPPRPGIRPFHERIEKIKGTAHILTKVEGFGNIRPMPRTARVAPGGMVFHVLNRGVCPGPTNLQNSNDGESNPEK